MKVFICLICDFTCNFRFSGRHLSDCHKISAKDYYDKFLKISGAEFCQKCKDETKFMSLSKGYKQFCKKCKPRKINENFLKLGITNSFQLESVKNKIKQKMIERYGEDNISKTNFGKEKKRKTCFEHYGTNSSFQSKEIKDKITETIRKKYNDNTITNVFQSEIMKNNIRKIKKEKYGDESYTNRAKADSTILERYGVTNVMFVDEISQKAALNGGGKAKAQKYLTKFGDAIIVQGSYEKKFVKYCEDNNFRIKNGPIIDYILDDKNRKYRIDFEVNKNNEIILVEIKSSYWYKKLKEQVDAKEKFAHEYCKSNNVSYKILIDKWSLE